MNRKLRRSIVEREVALLDARLARAREHFAAFSKIWEDYLAVRPHEFRETIAGGVLVKSLARRVPMPPELSIIFGEFLYELRAALDNALYAVAVLTSDDNPPPGAERLEWPIRLTRDDWVRQRSRLKHLPEVIMEALEAIQPFQVEYPEWNCLRILHDLARVDRHRAAHALGLYLVQGNIFALHDEVEVLHCVTSGVVRDGDEMVRLRLTAGITLSPANFDYNVEFDVDVEDVEESVGPGRGAPSRPWGPLHNRMRMLMRFVGEYADALLGIAEEHLVGAEGARSARPRG